MEIQNTLKSQNNLEKEDQAPWLQTTLQATVIKTLVLAQKPKYVAYVNVKVSEVQRETHAPVVN